MGTPRFRKQVELSNVNSYLITDYNVDGSVYSNTTIGSNSKYAGEIRTIADVVTPGYKKAISSGAVIMNPLTMSKDKRSSSSKTHTLGPHPQWGMRVVKGEMACVWAGSVGPQRPSWFDQRVNDAKARCLLRAHSKVAAEDFLALVTVAEAGKTAKMLAKPFSAADALLAKCFAKRAALVARGVNFGLAATSAWLEYRFGWRPILQDIQGIWKAYQNNLTSVEKPVRKVARASDNDIKWLSSNNVDTRAQPGFTGVTLRSDYTHTTKVTAGVIYQLRDLDFEDATLRRMGLRLSDVPASVWELVPFSFVVDRFLDVGVWLNAIQPRPGVNILGSWTTTVAKRLNTHKVMDAYVMVGTPLVKLADPGGTYSEEFWDTTRVANPTIPSLPTVNYRDLNLSQQIDHAALIVAKLKGLWVRS